MNERLHQKRPDSDRERTRVKSAPRERKQILGEDDLRRGDDGRYTLGESDSEHLRAQPEHSSDVECV